MPQPQATPFGHSNTWGPRTGPAQGAVASALASASSGPLGSKAAPPSTPPQQPGGEPHGLHQVVCVHTELPVASCILLLAFLHKHSPTKYKTSTPFQGQKGFDVRGSWMTRRHALAQLIWICLRLAGNMTVSHVLSLSSVALLYVAQPFDTGKLFSQQLPVPQLQQ